MKDDFLQRFLFEKLNIRGEIIRLSDTFSTVSANGDYPESVQQLLGEALAAVALMGSAIKFKGKISLQLQGNGPVNLLLAQISSCGGVRGHAHWKTVPGSQALPDVVGPGHCMISMEPDDGGEIYQGITALEGETLSATLENYFHRSEQLPTRLWLRSEQGRVAGMMLQQMPGEADDDDGWGRISTLAETVQDEELQELSVISLLRRLFHEEDIRLFDRRSIRFDCSCSQEKIEQVLIGLGPSEMTAILAAEGRVDVRCDFCNKQYLFDSVDIADLFTSGNRVPSPPTKH